MGRQILGMGLIILFFLGILGSSPLFATDFDFTQVNRECGLRLAYGKSTRKADVRLYSLLPRWGIFLIRPGHSGLGE